MAHRPIDRRDQRCDGRWTKLLVLAFGVAVASGPAVAEEDEAPFAARFADYAASPRGYRAIKREVLAWHETMTNGCAAFASTALRQLGLDVPERGKRDGWGVSRITFAFSDHLTEELGWVRIEDALALEPGDLVFTTGAPDHVFVFHSYQSRRRQIARAIDNQGRRYRRPLAPAPGTDVAGFAYALRAP